VGIALLLSPLATEENTYEQHCKQRKIGGTLVW